MKRALIIIQGLLMAIAAFFMVSLIYIIITNIFVLITGVEDISSEIDGCLEAMAVMVSIIIFYLWYKKYMDGMIEPDKIKSTFTLKNIGIFLALGVGCQLFFESVLSLIRPLLKTLFDYYDEVISSIFDADIIIVAVYVIILAPILEELMLRGILFGKLRQGLPFITANLIQAVVFGLYHWNVIQGIYAFAMGLLLGYVYERTGTLLAAIFVHMIINGSGFLILRLKLSWLNIWMMLIIGGVLLLGAIYLFSRTNELKNKE
ncbi:MAG: CPBP family intramembrane metalloprotease [Clostridiales bacterium]|nr:CPBP family intramembrane metalloprotease [Clostridiales bacterium]